METSPRTPFYMETWTTSYRAETFQWSGFLWDWLCGMVMCPQAVYSVQYAFLCSLMKWRNIFPDFGWIAGRLGSKEKSEFDYFNYYLPIVSIIIFQLTFSSVDCALGGKILLLQPLCLSAALLHCWCWSINSLYNNCHFLEWQVSFWLHCSSIYILHRRVNESVVVLDKRVDSRLAKLFSTRRS